MTIVIYHKLILHARSTISLSKRPPQGGSLRNSATVFNIKANDFRLIALVQYVDGILMIRFFGSNEEYDDIDAEAV
jgi:mRNA interferase HigB